MEYRFLGRSGLRVSALALGALTFGRESDEAESRRMLDRFVDAGGNFIDTADVYGEGASEEVLGRWLATRRRDDLVIATKVRYPSGPGPNQRGLSRKHLLASVATSLRRLQTDYIDLYQLHCWDHITPLEETLSTLNDLVRDGVVRYLGASNFSGWQLQKALDLCRYHGWEGFVSLQPQYNLLCRSTEWELVPVCLNEGLGLLPWSPLRGGWLSGKYRRDMAGPPPNTRIAAAEAQNWGESWSNYNRESTWQVIDALAAIAEEADKPMAAVAITWLLQRPAVTAPILGARTLAQLEANLGASDWALSDEQMRRLDTASAIAPPYPYNDIAEATARR